MPLKKLLVRQDRDAVGTGLMIDRSDSDRVEIRSDHTGRGGCFLDFTDESEFPGNQSFSETSERTQGGCSIMPVRGVRQPRLNLSSLMRNYLCKAAHRAGNLAQSDWMSIVLLVLGFVRS